LYTSSASFDNDAQRETNMTTGSLKLGKWFGIAVNMHWSVALIGMLLGASLGNAIGWAAGAAGVLGFLASILVHEFAHALTALRFDVGTDSIQLWALGGIARLDRESPTARAEGWIAVAGPAASVVLGTIGIGAWWAVGASSSNNAFIGLLGWLGIINILLAWFNLLPGAPLDGGRILKAIRWGRHGDRHRATQEAGRAGIVLGWLLAGLGFGLILRAQSGVWLMVTGLFIMINAQVEISAARIAGRLAGTKVRDLTWFGVAQAGADMDADSMLWQRRRLGAAGGVAITDDSGTPQGLVLEDELWAIPADERPWVMLTQMMVPFDGMAKADPDEELSAVLPRLNPRRPVVSVWQDGHLVGMVPPQRLRDRLSSAGL
jgi:Zn-dependent protease